MYNLNNCVYIPESTMEQQKRRHNYSKPVSHLHRVSNSNIKSSSLNTRI